MKHTTFVGGAVMLAWLAGGTAVGAEIASGELLGQNCAACHGTDGREFNEAMPSLAGMQPAVFVRAMQEFREGKRPAIVMDRIAKAFSDDEIEVMAAFFAEQPAVQYGEEAQ